MPLPPCLMVSTRGVPHLQENATPQDPAVGLCLGPYSGPTGVGAFLMSEVPLCIPNQSPPLGVLPDSIKECAV